MTDIINIKLNNISINPNIALFAAILHKDIVLKVKGKLS